MSAKTLINAVDEHYAALPISEEQTARDQALMHRLTEKLTFHEGRDAATRHQQLINDLLPLMRNHPEKISTIGNMILNEYKITAERITRRIEGCELPPSANHYIHHTGNPEELAALLTTGTEPVTNWNQQPVAAEKIAQSVNALTARSISLLTYALRAHWITTNQAWDILTTTGEDGNLLNECVLLASKLTDLTYEEATLTRVVYGMRHAHEEWGTRNVHDPLDLNTDEKLNHNAMIARATILAAGEDTRYTRIPDHRLIRNRRTQKQTMQGIQLHEMAVDLYRHYPDQHDEITLSLLVEGNSIMSTEALLNKAA